MAAVAEAEEVGGGCPELACPWVAIVERLSLDAYVLTNQKVLHPLQVSFFKGKK
jgi:hypothetical protein